MAFIGQRWHQGATGQRCAATEGCARFMGIERVREQGRAGATLPPQKLAGRERSDLAHLSATSHAIRPVSPTETSTPDLKAAFPPDPEHPLVRNPSGTRAASPTRLCTSGSDSSVNREKQRAPSPGKRFAGRAWQVNDARVGSAVRSPYALHAAPVQRAHQPTEL